LLIVARCLQRAIERARRCFRSRADITSERTAHLLDRHSSGDRLGSVFRPAGSHAQLRDLATGVALAGFDRKTPVGAGIFICSRF
jgi:hypothetical protein